MRASVVGGGTRVSRVSLWLRWLRQWWQNKYVSRIEHEEVIREVKAEGRLTSRFSFMVIMSCAIAMLGLLLSSPAVVIGAMLISPLMAPIVSLGFSLCLFDIQQMKKALEGLLVGIAMALFIAWLIVTASPLTDATPEILARTQPNLFDLLVAIFSGLAGGYAVIKRKGGAIVGVAIATALMPPLAVVGFGLATHSAPIAKGAFMLFMTNLLAISLSVTLIAKFYGFDERRSSTRTAWQILFIAIVFGVLSLPLGVALRDIAYQTYATKIAKATVQEYFGGEDSRISVFNIKFMRNKQIDIDTVVLTQQYHSRAQDEIRALLAKKISTPVLFSLDQVVVAHEIIAAKEPEPQPAPTPVVIERPIDPVLQAQVTRLNDQDAMQDAMRQAVFFATRSITVDVDRKQAVIYPEPAKGVSLLTLRQLEEHLVERYPDWSVTVVPPSQALPYVYYENGRDVLNNDAAERFGDILWALKRWEARKVVVVGFASTVGELDRFNNSTLAYRRAENVSRLLREHGIEAVPYGEYKAFRQAKEERAKGLDSFQRVEIRLAQVTEQEPSAHEKTASTD